MRLPDCIGKCQLAFQNHKVTLWVYNQSVDYRIEIYFMLFQNTATLLPY